MKELQRKQRIKRAMYSLPSLMFLIVIAFFLVRGAVGVLEKRAESARYVKELREEAQALTLRSQELEASIARLNTEEGVVEEIKEKYNVSLDGEHIAILVDDAPEPFSTDESKDEWYERWWGVILGLWQ